MWIVVAVVGVLAACRSRDDHWKRQGIRFAPSTFSAGMFVCDDYSVVKTKVVTVPAFELDRQQVTCSEYRACVDAGECEPEPCTEDRIDARWDSADAYCRFRGGHLPSHLEWQRGVRGIGAPSPEPTCSLPGKCSFTSSDGIQFTLNDPIQRELLRDRCHPAAGRRHNGIAVDILSTKIVLGAVDGYDGAFRCAYD